MDGEVDSGRRHLRPWVYCWHDYRRYARQSRLEQPDKFTLIATTPESLIDRVGDLERLLNAVMQNRIVLLDGEFGCGKSALVAAGLVPRLRSSDGLLPILVRDWGDDWIRGPLAAVAQALYGALTTEERGQIEWTSAPDLAAPAPALVSVVSERLDAVSGKLKRRPLLIADQFDDYQAQHRDLFFDESGNWLAPVKLAEGNPLWAQVCQRLQDGKMHLLAITRADTAAGLSCLRFLNNAKVATRTLPRIEIEYLWQLLAGIAPDDGKPAVISNPENGWFALREVLEADFRARGAVLMQQVRTVLLGLRQLPVLTPRAYRKAGGMSGTETLVISRALRSAGASLGGEELGEPVARALLNALVLPAAPDQAPKARRRTLSELAGIAGSPERAQRALKALQSVEIVRPAGGDAAEAWQLDHDYLARSVLTEMRRADPLGTALRDGFVRFRTAGDSWKARWTTLLPITTQAFLLWGKLRGRVRYGEAAGYARLSTLKPALLVGLCAFLGWSLWAAYEWNLVRDRAQALANRLGAGELAAVVDAWKAPDPVRTRLFEVGRD